MKMHKRFWILALALLVLLTVGGCLVSGTFIVTETFTDINFTTVTGAYYEYVDITDESVWEDHKDDIDKIKLVGFELWMTNNSADANEFDVWVAPGSDDALTTRGAVEASLTAKHVLVDVPIAAGVGTQTYISYSESFSHLQNVDALKTMVKEGLFHFYGFDDSNSANNDYTLDSVRVIITLEASS